MSAVRQKIATFDIDGTLFRSGLYREVFYELYKMNKVPEDLSEQATAKHREWRHRVHGNAFEEFDMFVVRGLDAYVSQLRVGDFDEAVKRVITKKADNVYVYTRDLLKSLQQRGYFTLAISGSQRELVEPFARYYHFDAWIGQEWERDENGGFFTGKITKTHTGKDKILQKFVADHDLTLEDSYAVGDSNGDSGMLGIVDHPIAFNPTTELLDKALASGWKIVIERKSLSYELSGHAGETFALTDVHRY